MKEMVEDGAWGVRVSTIGILIFTHSLFILKSSCNEEPNKVKTPKMLKNVTKDWSVYELAKLVF